MGNTITKNGVSSSTLTGLLISELPDITRAPRRAESTDVDGRDGDVVRYTGYDTYKKQVLVGLHGSYNIDAIINFFSGEGWWVFSNEPTKKYYGRITDATDFERLVRFRKGKVNITVQPYKKLVTEADVTGNNSTPSHSLTVHNAGYEICKPKIVITGTAGNVIVLSLDAHSVATVTIPPEGTITLDSEALNAYNSNADKNQYVVGDFMAIPSGDHAVSWTGTLTGITISPNSRFL